MFEIYLWICAAGVGIALFGIVCFAAVYLLVLIVVEAVRCLFTLRSRRRTRT